MKQQISFNGQGAALRQPWRQCITVGHAAELLRADVREHLSRLQALAGFRHIRFHAIFSDQMNVVRRLEDGSLRFQWSHVDKVYDTLLAMGLKPFVELNPMPTVLASTEQSIFSFEMNVSPPRDYGEWEALVEAFTHHCVDRYGLEEVRSWYFEVWNEPNLKGFWGGSQEEYWKLYAHAARAVKRVDDQLRVGGPASAGAEWIQEIIEYTEQAKVPLDFVSTHRYPQDEQVLYPDPKGRPNQPGRFFGEEVRRVHQVVQDSVRPDLEIHWTEWNSQSSDADHPVTWGANEFVDSSFAGSFIVKHCLETDAFCDSFAWWVVSDVFEEPGFQQAAFSCTYGLMTVDGIPKSSFHAFRFLSKLRGKTLTLVQGAEFPEGTGMCACEEAGVIRGLIWNHPPLEDSSAADWNPELKFPTVHPGPLRLYSARVEAHSGSAWESWKAMGEPHNLSETEREYLLARSEPAWSETALRAEDGEVSASFTLAPYSFVYVELRPQGVPAFGKGTDSSADLDLLEQQLTMEQPTE